MLKYLAQKLKAKKLAKYNYLTRNNMPKETRTSSRQNNTYRTRNGNDNITHHKPRDPDQRRSYSENDYKNSSRNSYPAETSFFQDKKKLLIGLGGVAGVAIAATIAGILISNSGKVKILSVVPATVSAKQPYQKCEDIETTRYSRNHKNGTEGAIIGGTGGAVAVGLLTHSWVGAGVGAVAGAVGGDLIQRSHQPNYIAHHSSNTECRTEYRQIQVPIGYQVSYLGKNDEVLQMTTRHQQQIGNKIALEDLAADEVTPEQQQTLIQKAVSAGENQSAN